MLKILFLGTIYSSVYGTTNDFALEILNEALWFTRDENYGSVRLTKKELLTEKDADYYTGNEYFEKIKSMGRAHNGFPEIVVSHSFGIGQLRFIKEEKVTQKIPEVTLNQTSFLSNIQTTFNLKRAALFAVYPPGGYISWHNMQPCTVLGMLPVLYQRRLLLRLHSHDSFHKVLMANLSSTSS